MNYVDSINLFGVNAKEIPCIKGEGAPTSATEGAVGCLYMDTASGDLYKCTAVNDGVYIWVKIGGDSAEGAVLYTEQTLTEEEKAQSRKNIGAAYVNPDGGIFEIEDDAGGVSIYMQADETDEYQLNLYGGADRGYVRICGLADGEISSDAATVGQLNAKIQTVNFVLDDKFVGEHDGETRTGFVTYDMTVSQMVVCLRSGCVLVGLFKTYGDNAVYTAIGQLDDGAYNESGCEEVIFGIFSHISDNRLIRKGTGGGKGNALWINYPLD